MGNKPTKASSPPSSPTTSPTQQRQQRQQQQQQKSQPIHGPQPQTKQPKTVIKSNLGSKNNGIRPTPYKSTHQTYSEPIIHDYPIDIGNYTQNDRSVLLRGPLLVKPILNDCIDTTTVNVIHPCTLWADIIGNNWNGAQFDQNGAELPIQLKDGRSFDCDDFVRDIEIIMNFISSNFGRKKHGDLILGGKFLPNDTKIRQNEILCIYIGICAIFRKYYLLDIITRDYLLNDSIDIYPLLYNNPGVLTPLQSYISSLELNTSFLDQNVLSSLSPTRLTDFHISLPQPPRLISLDDVCGINNKFGQGCEGILERNELIRNNLAKITTISMNSTQISKTISEFLLFLHTRQHFGVLNDLHGLNIDYGNTYDSFLAIWGHVYQNTTNELPLSGKLTPSLFDKLYPTKLLVANVTQSVCLYQDILFSLKKFYNFFNHFISATLTHTPNFILNHPFYQSSVAKEDGYSQAQFVLHKNLNPTLATATKYQSSPFFHPSQLLNSPLSNPTSKFPSIFNQVVYPQRIITGIDSYLTQSATPFSSPQYTYQLTDNNYLMIVQTNAVHLSGDISPPITSRNITNASSSDKHEQSAKSTPSSPPSFPRKATQIIQHHFYTHLFYRYEHFLFFIHTMIKVQTWALIGYINYIRLIENKAVLFGKTDLPEIPNLPKFTGLIPERLGKSERSEKPKKPEKPEKPENKPIKFPKFASFRPYHAIHYESINNFDDITLYEQLRLELDELRDKNRPVVPISVEKYTPITVQRNELLNTFKIQPQKLAQSALAQIAKTPNWLPTFLSRIANNTHLALGRGGLGHSKLNSVGSLANYQHDQSVPVNLYTYSETSQQMMDSWKSIFLFAFSEVTMLYEGHSMLVKLSSNENDHFSQRGSISDVKFKNIVQQSFLTNIEIDLEKNPFLDSFFASKTQYLSPKPEFSLTAGQIDTDITIDQIYRHFDVILPSSRDESSIISPNTHFPQFCRPRLYRIIEKDTVKKYLQPQTKQGGQGAVFHALATILRTFSSSQIVSISSSNVDYQNYIHNLFYRLISFVKQIFGKNGSTTGGNAFSGIVDEEILGAFCLPIISSLNFDSFLVRSSIISPKNPKISPHDKNKNKNKNNNNNNNNNPSVTISHALQSTQVPLVPTTLSTQSLMYDYHRQNQGITIGTLIESQTPRQFYTSIDDVYKHLDMYKQHTKGDIKELTSSLKHSIDYNLFEAKNYRINDFILFNHFNQNNSLSPIVGILTPIFSQQKQFFQANPIDPPTHASPSLSNIPLHLALFHMYEGFGLLPGSVSFPHREFHRFSLLHSHLDKVECFNPHNPLPVQMKLHTSKRYNQYVQYINQNHRFGTRIAVEYRPKQLTSSGFSESIMNVRAAPTITSRSMQLTHSLSTGVVKPSQGNEFTAPWNPAEHIDGYFQAEIYNWNQLRVVPVLNPYRYDDDLMGVPAATMYGLEDGESWGNDGKSDGKSDEQNVRFENTIFGNYNTIQPLYENYNENNDILTLYRSTVLLARKLLSSSLKCQPKLVAKESPLTQSKIEPYSLNGKSVPKITPSINDDMIDLSYFAQLARLEYAIEKNKNKLTIFSTNLTTDTKSKNTTLPDLPLLISLQSEHYLQFKRHPDQKWNPVLIFGPRIETNLFNTQPYNILTTPPPDIPSTPYHRYTPNQNDTSYPLEVVSTTSVFQSQFDTIKQIDYKVALASTNQYSNVLNLYKLSTLLSTQHLPFWSFLFQRGIFWAMGFKTNTDFNLWGIQKNTLHTFDNLKVLFRLYMMIYTLSHRISSFSSNGGGVGDDIMLAVSSVMSDKGENSGKDKDSGEKDGKIHNSLTQSDIVTNSTKLKPTLLYKDLLCTSSRFEAINQDYKENITQKDQLSSNSTKNTISNGLIDALYTPHTDSNTIIEKLTQSESSNIRLTSSQFCSFCPFFTTTQYTPSLPPQSPLISQIYPVREIATHYTFHQPQSPQHQILNNIAINSSFLAPLFTSYAPSLTLSLFKLAVSALDRLVYMSKTLRSYKCPRDPAKEKVSFSGNQTTHREQFFPSPSGSFEYSDYSENGEVEYFFVPRSLAPGSYTSQLSGNSHTHLAFFNEFEHQPICQTPLTTTLGHLTSKVIEPIDGSSIKKMIKFDLFTENHSIPPTTPNTTNYTSNTAENYYSQYYWYQSTTLPQLAPLTPLEYHLLWVCFGPVAYTDQTFAELLDYTKSNAPAWFYTKHFGAYVSADLHDASVINEGMPFVNGDGEIVDEACEEKVQPKFVHNFNPYFLKCLLYIYSTNSELIINHIKSMYILPLDIFLEKTYELMLKNQTNLWSSFHATFGIHQSYLENIDWINENDIKINSLFPQHFNPSRFPFHQISESLIYIDAGVTTIEHSTLHGMQFEVNTIQSNDSKVYVDPQWVDGDDNTTKLDQKVFDILSSIHPQCPRKDDYTTTGNSIHKTSQNPSKDIYRPEFKPAFYPGLLYFFIDSLSNPSLDDLFSLIHGVRSTIRGLSFEQQHYAWLSKQHHSHPDVLSYREAYGRDYGSTEQHDMQLLPPCLFSTLQPYQYPAYLQHAFVQYHEINEFGSRKCENNEQNGKSVQNASVLVHTFIRAIQRGHKSSILASLFNTIQNQDLLDELFGWKLFIQRRSIRNDVILGTIGDYNTNTTEIRSDSCGVKKEPSSTAVVGGSKQLSSGDATLLIPVGHIYSTTLTLLDLIAINTQSLFDKQWGIVGWNNESSLLAHNEGDKSITMTHDGSFALKSSMDVSHNIKGCGNDGENNNDHLQAFMQKLLTHYTDFLRHQAGK